MPEKLCGGRTFFLGRRVEGTVEGTTLHISKTPDEISLSSESSVNHPLFQAIYNELHTSFSQNDMFCSHIKSSENKKTLATHYRFCCNFKGLFLKAPKNKINTNLIFASVCFCEPKIKLLKIVIFGLCQI